MQNWDCGAAGLGGLRAQTTLRLCGAWVASSVTGLKASDRSTQPQAHRFLTLRPWGEKEACLLVRSFILCFVYHRQIKLLLAPDTVLEMTAVLKITIASQSSRSFSLIIVIIIYPKPVICPVSG